MKKKLATLAVITLTMISCGSTQKSNDQTKEAQSQSTDITNTTWELVKLGGEDVDQSETVGKKIQFTLNSADEMAFGYSGCNTFNGGYTLEEGNRISFSQMASTRMACPKGDVNEQDVLDVFNSTDNYTINNGVLSLNVGKRAPLAVFKKVKSEDKIVEKHWKLVKLEGQDVEMADNQEREIYFRLKTADNSLLGFAGCNTLNGQYKLKKGNQIQFLNIGVTMKLCPDVDVDESAFLKVFELADNYNIRGDQLMLNVGRRAPLAVFEAVYF
ncbi:MAG: META domain-containing protein [Tetragenococcus koreensis]|nr:META domain-containing protein [Tetragenococcus koreensis]MDN6310661.1 META domain-containing protein [Psychroflexus sp.]